VIALLLAWGAVVAVARSSRRSGIPTGYRRASILAALFNAGLLLVAVGGIVVEAVNRLAEPARSRG
jgi:cobalt-zinc-cadmium efflux system protein